MNTKTLLLASLLTISKISFSQKSDSLPCPKLVLDGPDRSGVYEGQEAIVRLRSFKKNTIADSSLTFRWVVNQGFITKGQNAREVYINTRGLANEEIKAVIFITGLQPNCPNSADIVISVKKNVPIRTETKIIASPNGRGY